MTEENIWIGKSTKDGQEIIAVQSCGFLVFRNTPNGGKEFLLLKLPERYDLPKGHREIGETEMQTALRELQEETRNQRRRSPNRCHIPVRGDLLPTINYPSIWQSNNREEIGRISSNFE